MFAIALFDNSLSKIFFSHSFAGSWSNIVVAASRVVDASGSVLKAAREGMAHLVRNVACVAHRAYIWHINTCTASSKRDGTEERERESSVCRFELCISIGKSISNCNGSCNCSGSWAHVVSALCCMWLLNTNITGLIPRAGCVVDRFQSASYNVSECIRVNQNHNVSH